MFSSPSEGIYERLQPVCGAQILGKDTSHYAKIQPNDFKNRKDTFMVWSGFNQTGVIVNIELPS